MTSSNPHDPLNDAVTAQYEKYAFPPPGDEFFDSMHLRQSHNFRLLGPTFWPNTPDRDEMDILVAGCGTNLAAAISYQFPKSRVVGIDISSASLAHEEFLKQKHKLDNLTLLRLPIEEVHSLGQEFDAISVFGVLHHLQDPVAGLHALGNVLRRDGVIAVGIYATYGRQGVYMIQDLCRRLGLSLEPQDINVVRGMLGTVNATHPVQNYIQKAIGIGRDTVIVDTFLHARDRSYTVGECLQLVADAKLTFQGWDEPAVYHPDVSIVNDSPLGQHLARLDGPKLWEAMELFMGSIAMHRFHVCRNDRDPRTYRIQFEGDDFLNYVPAYRLDIAIENISENPPRLQISRTSFPFVRLSESQTQFFRRIDGLRCVRDCLDKNWTVDTARMFMRSLWRSGYLTFRIAR